MKSMFKNLIAGLCFAFISVSFSHAQVPEISAVQFPGMTGNFSAGEFYFTRQNADLYTINPESIRVRMVEVKEPGDSVPGLQVRPVGLEQAAQAVVLLDKIVNIATKIWDIVTKNAPVTNIDTKYAVAWPEGVTSASQLAGWSRPRTYVYSFYAENLYGSKTIDVRYRVSYAYGGNYKGKGKFLTGVSIVPEKVEVAWGYRFSMKAEVPDSTIANVGTYENPMASMQLKLNWKISTVLKDATGTSVYYIQGDGDCDEIASPFDKIQITESPLAKDMLETGRTGPVSAPALEGLPAADALLRAPADVFAQY